MKNIVLIDHEPLTVRREQIFQLQELQQAGFKTEFWDCSQYFHPDMYLADTLNRHYVRKFNNIRQIAAALQECKIGNTIFVIETFRNWQNRKFFRLLTRYNCHTVRIELYATATLPDISLFRKILHSSPAKFFHAVGNRLQSTALQFYNKFYNIKDYDQVISSGSRTVAHIRINHPDWEKYIRSFDTPDRIVTGNYAVFLDEYFPLHPDLLFFIKNRSKNPEPYYRTLNRFFDDYEHRTGNRIIIAAHPKSSYAPNTFGHREIRKYQSAELVRDAQAVFMHSSAALSYVMMYDKPLALITTGGYKRTFALYVNMIRISRLTQLPIHNIETSYSEVIPQNIPSQIRQRYIYDYLTSPGIETQHNSEIFCRIFHEV